jgi:glycosyltransferase involved in cell wall biosynthesis
VRQDAPEVSVVIPTRDRARLLPDAIATSLGQEGVDLEVIVVDDGSRDETPELLARVGDERLRVIRFDPERGQSKARIAGVDAARGRWLAFLDDDDLWSPSKLRLQLDAAERSGATWAYCGVLLVSPEGDVVRVSGPPRPEDVLREVLRANVVQAGASTVIVQADQYHAVGGFQDGLHNPWDLWIRLAADGPAAAVDEPLVAYRRHPGSFISGNRQVAMSEARHIAEKYRSLSAAHGVAFDLDAYGRWLDSERLRGMRSLAMVRFAEGRRPAAFRLQLRVLVATRKLQDLRRLVRIVAGNAAKDVFRLLAPAPEALRSAEPIPDWLSVQLDRSRDGQ